MNEEITAEELQAMDESMRLVQKINPRLKTWTFFPNGTQLSPENYERYKKGDDSFMWAFTDEKDKTVIRYPILGEIILNSFPMFYDNFRTDGYHYSSDLGVWRSGMDAFAGNKVTEKLTKNNLWTVNRRNSTKQWIKDHSFKDTSSDVFELKGKANLINFNSRSYDIKRNEFKKNSPKDYLIIRHEFELDMAGQAKLTNRWFKETFREAADFMKIWNGFVLSGSYSDFQHFLMVISRGGQGKSTFFNYEQKLFGEENVSNVSMKDLANDDRHFDSSQLYHKIANVFGDVSPDFLPDVSQLKALSGGDRLKAEFKNRDPFMFANEAKLMFGANDLPKSVDDTNGFSRRPRVVVMHAIPGVKDWLDKNQLKRERGAFAFQCIRMYQDYLKHPQYEDEEYPVLPETAQMRLDRMNWIESNNNVLQFIKDECEVGEDLHYKRTYLYEDYHKYCDDSGVKSFGKKKFFEKIRNLGYEEKQIKINGAVARAFIGVGRR